MKRTRRQRMMVHKMNPTYHPLEPISWQGPGPIDYNLSGKVKVAPVQPQGQPSQGKGRWYSPLWNWNESLIWGKFSTTQTSALQWNIWSSSQTCRIYSWTHSEPGRCHTQSVIWSLEVPSIYKKKTIDGSTWEGNKLGEHVGEVSAAEDRKWLNNSDLRMICRVSCTLPERIIIPPWWTSWSGQWSLRP